MRMTCELPDHAAAVEALLEGFVRAALVIIGAGLAPPDPRQAKVVYKLEPPGEEDWKLPHNVVRDGWGDCEDIAGWRAAGLRFTGEDPGARVIVVKTGKDKATGQEKLHAVVERSDGTIDDVCKEMWLNQPEGRRHVARVLGVVTAAQGMATPGKQVVAPDGRIIDVPQGGKVVVKDHRPGGNASTTAPNADARAYAQYLQQYKYGGNARDITPPKWGTDSKQPPAFDPVSGDPVSVNLNPGRDVYGPYGPVSTDPYANPYGYPNPYNPYGYPTQPNDPYGYLQAQYGYGQYPYGQMPYGMYAPQSWFPQVQNPNPWGGGGWQNDGSWVDPRAVAAFATDWSEDYGSDTL